MSPVRKYVAPYVELKAMLHAAVVLAVLTDAVQVA
jgi:hypothetical protein